MLERAAKELDVVGRYALEVLGDPPVDLAARDSRDVAGDSLSDEIVGEADGPGGPMDESALGELP